MGRDRADELVDDRQPRRAIENIAYVVAANQGASLRHYPPYSWPGGSQVVDFDGRMLAEASPGPGERIVVAPIDISALRHERRARGGHHMLAHLRTEAYAVYRGTSIRRRTSTAARRPAVLSYEDNVRLIGTAKKTSANFRRQRAGTLAGSGCPRNDRDNGERP